MVSTQNGTPSPANHPCLWSKCPKSSVSFDTPEKLLDHVFESHIPTTIKNEDDEEEVVCEWEDCEMGTTRGSIEKKTEWMQIHFKTRHVKSAKTCKCVFEGCDVLKSTTRELESHVRMVHFAKPKKEKKKAPEPVEEKEPTNRIWSIINGRVIWKKPPKVTEKIIIFYEDGPRFVYPAGHERDSESDWELSEEETYERMPPQSFGPCYLPKPNEKGPFIRPFKKKSAEKIEAERKMFEKAREVERKRIEEEERKEREKEKEKEATRQPPAKPKMAPSPPRDLNDNIILPDALDDFDTMPSLKAFYEDSDSEAEVVKPQKPKKKVTFNDIPQFAPSPVKTTTPVEKVKKVASKVEKTTVKQVLKLKSSSAVVKKASRKPIPSEIIKKAVKVQEKRSSSKTDRTQTSPAKAATFKPKTTTAPKPRSSKKLTLGKRPSRACRVLGSMEEVPFEMEIEVEFEKPKKLLKTF